MVLFDVIISPKALSQLDSYIDYILNTLMNPQAAMNLWHDAEDTREELSKCAGSLSYENGTAQSFAKLLPLTAELWTPIHYAQAFDLPQRIPDNDERTRAYERGTIGYWYEGPSIALLYGEDEAQTAVPIVKIGNLLSNLSALETYRGTVTVELAHQG